MHACPLKTSEKQMLPLLADGKQPSRIASAIGALPGTNPSANPSANHSTIHAMMQRIRARIEAGKTIAAILAYAMRKGWMG